MTGNHLPLVIPLGAPNERWGSKFDSGERVRHHSQFAYAGMDRGLAGDLLGAPNAAILGAALRDAAASRYGARR
jgi:hypothetical protein